MMLAMLVQTYSTLAMYRVGGSAVSIVLKINNVKYGYGLVRGGTTNLT